MIFLFGLNLLYAQSDPLDDFNLLLEEATEIATKSRLNVDYVPGTVSIVTGEELKTYGVTNLAQLNSMDMIVGMETVTSSLRGVGPMYGAVGNKIKWMVNGKVLETETRDTDDWAKGPVLFPFSVDQVDRIEVIRGPGSAIYGGNAIFGVVNIITKKETHSIFAGAEYLGGDNQAGLVGGNTYYEGEDFSINLSISGYHSDGDYLTVGTDGLFWRDWGKSNGTNYVPGNAPGVLPNQNQGYSFLGDVNFDNAHFWLNRFSVRSGQGHQSWYPTDSFPPDDGKMVKTMIHTMSGLEFDFNLWDWKITPEIGVTLLDNPANNYYKTPAGEYGFTYDGYRRRQYREEKYYTEWEVTRKFDSHNVLFGAFFQDSEIKKAEMEVNYNFSDKTSDNWYRNDSGFFPEGNPRGRRQMAYYLQDQWSVDDETTLTYGTRYDEYSDVSSAWSPRIALIHQLNQKNIFKAQLSRAFRAPSLFEAYGYMSSYQHKNQKILKPEMVDTYEVGHVYKYGQGDLKTTLFHTFMDEMIIQDYGSYIYENLRKKARTQGIEIESSWHNDWLMLKGNMAVYDTLNMVVDESFVNAASWYGNIMATYLPQGNLSTTLWYHYIGDKPRNQGGQAFYQKTSFTDNGFISEQHIFNISQKYRGFAKNLEIDYGMRNIFDQKMVMEYMPQDNNTNDIPYMGQTYWLNATYRF